MKIGIFLGLAFGAVCLLATPGWAAPVEERMRQLEERLQRQEELVESLRQQEKPRPETFRAYWKEGIHLDSTDHTFRVKIGGRMQNDWAFITEDQDIKDSFGSLANGTEFRRARLYLSGLLYDQIEFKFQYDFAEGDVDFKDVYMGLTDLPVVGGLRIGHFKEPFSLEKLTSSNYITFMERGLPSALFPSRSTGFMLHNHALNQRVTWAVGAFKGSDNFGDRTSDGEFNFTGRLTALPWYQDNGRYLVHLGLAYSYRNPNDNQVRFRARPEVHLAPRFVDTSTLTADNLQMVGLEGAIVYGPASLQGEYTHATVDTAGGNPQLGGFYVYGSYFLTGENRNYKSSKGAFERIRPARNFHYGSWTAPGAWEIAARYSHIDLNDQGSAGGRLDDLTLGLNWYLNPNTRIMANYVLADLQGTGKAQMGQMRFQLFF